MDMNTMNNTALTAEQINERKEAAAFIDFKMVTFDLAGKDYGIDIMHVKEIAKAGRFTYVPNTQPFVLGVYNLRGEIIPILDLRIFFNIPVQPHDNNKLQNLLILSIDDQIFGLVVDKIDKVIGVQKSTIQPPHPLFGDINIKYINGVVENNNRLYVLLDVMRIFSVKEKEEQEDINKYYQENTAKLQMKKEESTASPAVSAVAPKAQAAPVVKEQPKTEIDIKFIAENLAQYKNFYVTDINNSWVKFRFADWEKEKAGASTQLQNAADADEYLKSFWSVCSDKWWTEDYANAVKAVLPDNAAKTIIVWNPGCGKGMESYSLACILKAKYPQAMIKIYAQDVDLLSVSNAALLSVPAELAGQWYGPYLTQKANGEYTFSPEIKESILFEYHDCKNTNVLPMVDVIFARDVLSLCDAASQDVIISDFQEKVKGNGIIVVGDNEVLPAKYGFGEKSAGSITAYTKD
ncbi:MAG: chemotaxis protein CheW [Treponema sp.]|nr:chemotaxis protein CheW [Treponema sp.]